MNGYFVALVILLTSGNAFAANHYVRAGATGTNDGTSWANAWPSFASVTWTRGDTYYLAGGTYAGNVTIPTRESGSLWITIKKANAADNASDTGWDASYATTQAVIDGSLQVYYGYFVLDGVTGAGTSGHGIKIQTSTSLTVVIFSSGASPRQIHHVEVLGPGYAYGSTAADGVYFNSSAPTTKGFIVSYCWIHEIPRNGITTSSTVGTSYADYGMLIENNVISETGGLGRAYPDQHGQGMQIAYASPDAYTIIRNNVFRNIRGSCNICFLGAGAHSQSRIYNNVFYYTDLDMYDVSSPGVIGAWASTFTDIYIYNNTFYSIGSPTNTGVLAQIANANSAPTNVEVKNNLWVNSNFTSASYGTTAKSNNDFYSNTGTAPSGETNPVTESADPFIDSARFDFRLKCTANASHAGIDLSDVFSSDILGHDHSTGSWAIGAYKCYGVASPPSNVRIIR